MFKKGGGFFGKWMTKALIWEMPGRGQREEDICFVKIQFAFNSFPFSHYINLTTKLIINNRNVPIGITLFEANISTSGIAWLERI